MRLNKLTSFLIVVSIALTGCAKTYRTEFLKRAEEKGYNKQQQLAALYYSYRLYFGKENSGQFDMIYSRLSKEDVTKQLDSYLEDLNIILSYKDDDWGQYLGTFKLRPFFEHQEKTLQSARARIRAAEIHDEFETMMGSRSWYSSSRDEYGYDHILGYSPAILILKDFGEKFPFKNTTIEEAKTRGILKEVARFTVTNYRKFDHKDPDPWFPDDSNMFVWRSVQYNLEVVEYKILENDKPNDNFGNYIEAHRIVDGKKESSPAFRAFLYLRC